MIADPGWRRTSGFYFHPHCAGIIQRREGDSRYGLAYEVSKHMPYEGRGWVVISGLASWGVFPTLRRAKKWIMRHLLRKAKDRVAYTKIDRLKHRGHTDDCAHHTVWSKAACTCKRTEATR